MLSRWGFFNWKVERVENQRFTSVTPLWGITWSSIRLWYKSNMCNSLFQTLEDFSPPMQKIPKIFKSGTVVFSQPFTVLTMCWWWCLSYNLWQVIDGCLPCGEKLSANPSPDELSEHKLAKWLIIVSKLFHTTENIVWNYCESLLTWETATIPFNDNLFDCRCSSILMNNCIT